MLAKPFGDNAAWNRVASVGLWAMLIASIATLVVSAFVLLLDFSQRVHRAFALLLLLRAMLDGFLFFNESTTDLAGRLRIYWYLAVPFAALHFALAYRRRHGRRASTRPAWLAPLVILAVAIAFELAYFLDHGLAGSQDNPGPLLAFVFLPWPVYSAMALLFAVEHGRTGNHTSRKALELAALGMSLAPLFFSTFELLLFARQWIGNKDAFLPGSFSLAAAAAHLVSVILVTQAMRLLARAPELGRRFLVGPWIAAVGTAVGTVIAFEFTNGTNLLRIFLAAWAFMLPACVTYALVRHRLFDAEVKLRFAIKGTTLTGSFLAVFIIFQQLIQAASNQLFGAIGGAIAAGLLLFALTPLQRWADRVAYRTVPGKAKHGSHAERLQIYREQLEIAWADGRLTAKERLLFSKLQERLGISAEEAGQVERSVLESLAGPPRRQGAATA